MFCILTKKRCCRSFKRVERDERKGDSMKLRQSILLSVVAFLVTLWSEAADPEKGLILTGHMDSRLKIKATIWLAATHTWNPFCMQLAEGWKFFPLGPVFVPKVIEETIEAKPSGDDNQYYLNIDASKFSGGHCGYAKISNPYNEVSASNRPILQIELNEGEAQYRALMPIDSWFYGLESAEPTKEGKNTIVFSPKEEGSDDIFASKALGKTLNGVDFHWLSFRKRTTNDYKREDLDMWFSPQAYRYDVDFEVR